MARSPEKVAADATLTAAIEQVFLAYDFGAGSLLTDYVVCAVRQSFDSEGEARTEYVYLVRDESLPDYRIIGLLEAIRDRFRGRMMYDIDDDDD